MFSAGAESLLHQAREIEDGELQKFCSRLSQLLGAEDAGPEAVDALRRLFLILSATKYPRRLEKSCVDLLQAPLRSPTGPEQVQVLCAAILREMSPCDSLSLSCERAHDARQLSLLASVLLAQGDRRQEVSNVGQRVCKVLESRQPEGPSLRHLLPVLAKVISLAPGSLQEARPRHRGGRGGGHGLLHGAVHGPALHRGPVAERAGLLHAAGVAAARRPRGPWRPRRRQQIGAGGLHAVRAVCRLHRQPPAAPPGAAEGGGLRVLPAPRGAEQPASPEEGRRGPAESLPGGGGAGARPAVPPGPLLPVPHAGLPAGAARAAGHGPGLRAGAAAPRPVLPEPRGGGRGGLGGPPRAAVHPGPGPALPQPRAGAGVRPVLPGQPARAGWGHGHPLPELPQPPQGRCTDPSARATVGRGVGLGVSTAEPDRGCVLTESRARPLPAAQPLPEAGRGEGWLVVTGVAWDRGGRRRRQPAARGRVSYPVTAAVALQFLAWHSPPLTSEFVALLPALVDAGSAVELLHALLDLPCLTAALDLQLRSSPAPSERPLWDASLRNPSCLEASRDPQFQGLFRYLLRTKACGSVERLSPLHQLLQPMASCARVMQCAEAVPTLLQAFFSAVMKFADGALTSQLALLLLERSDSLYAVPGFEARVHRVLSSQFLALCQRKPSLVVELARALLELVGHVGRVCSTASLVTSVVWAIGEYLSVTCDRRCTVEQINRFFEALEALLFEVTQSRPSATLPACPPQVITALMTTLTKLASRSQDLIPRVSLFLSKLRTWAPGPSPVHGEDVAAVRTRATELLNLLRMPSVAQFVLTPSVAVCDPRYHRDTHTALPLALRTASRLAEQEAGLLPA